MTRTIEESIELNVPARTAYEQGTQFQEFPRFLSGVTSVEQLNDSRVKWRLDLGFRPKECVIEICEQIPDKRIAWRSVSGPRNAGVVTFHRLSDETSRVMVQVEYEPGGLGERVADLLGRERRFVADQLAQFATFLDARGEPTGAWRGTIPSPDDRGF